MDSLALLLVLSIFLLILAILVLLMLIRRLTRGRRAAPRPKAAAPPAPQPRPAPRETTPREPRPEPPSPPSAQPVARPPIIRPRPDRVSRAEETPPAPPPRPARADVMPETPPQRAEQGPIRVVIVDDISDTREGLIKLLRFEKDIEVVGTARSGREGIEAARELQPDIILMDINMPDMDGIAAAEIITREAPQSQLIMMSVQSDSDYLRRSMLAGARDFLIKPFDADDLIATIHRVCALGARRPPVVALTPMAAGPAPSPARPGGARRAQIIVVYSPQPGAGCTTLAINLAVAIQQTGAHKVALVDGHFQFGDVGLCLNLTASRSIADLVSAMDDLDAEFVEDIMLPHSSGIRALLAPPRPELSDLITADALRRILTLMAEAFDVIIIDSWSLLQEVTLASLELCDRLILVVTQEIPSVKNAKLFLDAMEAANFPLNKLALVLNRADPRAGVDPLDIERSIQHSFIAQIPADWRLATYAANRGVPFMISHGGSRLAQGVNALASTLLTPKLAPEAPGPS